MKTLKAVKIYPTGHKIEHIYNKNELKEMFKKFDAKTIDELFNIIKNNKFCNFEII